MSTLPYCPNCNSPYTYEDGSLYICPECAHEWNDADTAVEEFIVKDSNGAVLAEGDTVTVIKDLKVKGSSSVIKVGTKIKNIRLVNSADNHNIDCKIDGFGGMKITPQYVKKA